MVVLSCALCTKAGKVLLSRQFVEMTRIRIEGLLAAFPKLMGSDSRQHTFVETESVRYVYLPIDNLYLLLITNRASNIVEDLETLKLLSKIVPSIANPVGSSLTTALTEEKVLDTSFELIFAFDEVITAGGYREPINMQQVRTNMEMESHEEKLHMMIKLSKMETAKESARDAAKAIREKQREAARFGSMASATGFGSDGGADGMGGGGGGKLSMSEQLGMGISGTTQDSTFTDAGFSPSFAGNSSGSGSSSTSTSRTSLPPKKGMSLGAMGGKSRNLEDALLKEDKLAPVALTSSAARSKAAAEEAASASSAAAAAAAAAVVQHPVMLSMTEKVSAHITRDGVLEMFDIKGTLNLVAATDEAAMCAVQLKVANPKMFAFNTHPKVNKQLYEKSHLLQLKDPSKGFPSQRPVGILRWAYSNTGNEELIPLKINCWPEEEAGGNMNVSIEYEMDLQNGIELHDVRIHIPLGTSDAPNIVNVDGAHKHNANTQELIWDIALIDDSNRTGSLEFNIKQRDPDAFFPVTCTFASQQMYCQCDVESVRATNSDVPIVYGLTKGMSEDDYTIG